MDRARRLQDLWSWLPAFRIVAETQHLPTAARLLHVSPSALSRSVTQLEHALGRPLFVRAHRALRLNAEGAQLLAAVRDAMRRLDDGLAAALADPSRERLRVRGLAAFVRWLVVPVADELPVEILPATGEHEIAAGLLRGEADLVLAESVRPVDGIVVTRLGDVPWAVCRATARDPRRTAWCEEAPGPAAADRAPQLRVRDLDALVEACASLRYDAVLPIPIARMRALHVCARPKLAATPLVLVRRQPLGAAGPIDDLADRVARRAVALLRS